MPIIFIYSRQALIRPLANIRRVGPKARIFEVSAKTGQGMDSWCDYLTQLRSQPASTQPR